MELVEQFLGILDKQTKLIDEIASSKSGGNSLVSKNIIKSDNSTFDSNVVQPSKLNSKERARTMEASSIFITKFFDEEKKNRKDTSEKTSISKLVKPNLQVRSKSLTSLSEKKGNDDSIIGKLMGWLGMGALGKLLKPGELIKTLFKKGLSKISNKLKGVISSIWGGTKNLTSKILNNLGSTASKAWDGMKGIFGSIKDKTIGMFEKVGSKISGLWGTITNSSAYKTFSGVIDDAASALSKVFQGVKSKVGTLISKGSEQVAKIIPTPIKTIAAKAGSVTKTVGKTVGGWLGRAGGAIKGTAMKAGGVIKNVGKVAVDSAKNLVKSTVKNAVKESGGMIGMMGKLTAKGARGVAKVPIIGPAIEAAFTAYDVAEMKKKGLSDSELQQMAGKRVISGVTGMLGAASGSILAGALGSIVPGAGTALGVIVGGMAGDAVGRFLGGLVTDYILPAKYTKTIGSFVTGTPLPKDEMQDFIIKNGKVHKFSNKDDVMGMKTGGAIDEFLKGGSGNNQTMQLIIDSNNIANQYLRAIAQNTAIMVNKLSNKPSNVSPIIVSSPPSKGTPTKQMMTMPNNRSGYAGSAYAL